MARALGAGPVIDAVALAAAPAEERQEEEQEVVKADSSGRRSQAGPADSAGGGRFGNTGKWVPSLSGAR